MTNDEFHAGAMPAADAEVRGNSSKLFKAAALFATGIAATAAMMGTSPHKISDVIGDMQARRDQAKQTAPAAQAPAGNQSAAVEALPTVRPTPAAVAMTETDRARIQILSRPVPSDTRAAAEMARATPLPQEAKVDLPSAEQTQVLAYGQFAPIAARVFNNATKQKETHWTLHPWDVARLADQASDELFKERRIRVEPRLIAGAYYTESSGVVQVGFDRKGVDLLNEGKSIDQVFKSGAKASYGLFQIDQQHEGAADPDPVRSAKKAAEFLAEGQANLKRYPQLGMLAVSATYNASSNLREKIFTSAALDEREFNAYDTVLNHAASMSFGAALYDVAHRTYQQHLIQARKMGVPVAVAANTATRTDPLQGMRVDAVLALTGRSLQEARIQTEAVPAPLTAAAPAPAPTAQAQAVSVQAAAPVAKPAEAPAVAPMPARPIAVAATTTKPSLRDAMKMTAAAPSQGKAARATAARRSVDDATPAARSPSSTQDMDRFILAGAARDTRASAQERAIVVPSPERTRAAMDSSVNAWKSGAVSMLGRVASFHAQRTREMSGQREAP